jgi:hypothetical protein
VLIVTVDEKSPFLVIYIAIIPIQDAFLKFTSGIKTSATLSMTLRVPHQLIKVLRLSVDIKPNLERALKSTKINAFPLNNTTI